MSDRVTSLVIGDPHFRYKNISTGIEFINRCVKLARELEPTFIVLLGDILDTHEIVRVQPHKLACEFIEKLSEIAQTYVLIGNHDLINHTQFLTDNHIFNPLKEWKDVTIVDKPVYVEYENNTFVMCPYVPNGRFIEALNTLVKEEGADMWENVDCIFAHQEFRGCMMGIKPSTTGDEWDENFPPVISGHIHDEQVVGTNIFYTGSAIQHSFGESAKKKIWFVTFDISDDPPYFGVEKYDLGMKRKKIIKTDVYKIKELDLDDLQEKYEIKLSINGTEDEIKVFRRGQKFKELQQHNIRYTFKIQETVSEYDLPQTENISFLSVFETLVSQKDENIQTIYKEIIGN